MSNSLVNVLQIGARHHYAVPIALSQRGVMGTLFTDFYCGDDWGGLTSAISRLPYGVKAAGRLKSRSAADLPPESVWHSPILAGLFGALRRLPLGSVSRNALYCRMAERFVLQAIKHGALNCDTLFAFNGAAKEAFLEGRRDATRLVLDQTLAARPYMNECMEKVVRDFGYLQPSFTFFGDRDERHERELVEWECSDTILCPSEFVAGSLRAQGVRPDKLVICPYGVAMTKASNPTRRTKTSDEPLRILFVGEVGLRKGAPYLIEALRTIKRPVHCRMVGPISLNLRDIEPPACQLEVLGAVPRPEMDSHYRWADLFVLPTLFEGSATVIYEALSNCVRVVTTANAGAPPVDGVTIIPTDDVVALVDAIEQFEPDENWLEKLDAGFEMVSRDGYSRRMTSLVARYAADCKNDLR